MSHYLWGVGSGVVLLSAAHWAWRKYDGWGRVLRAWDKLRHKAWGDPE